MPFQHIAAKITLGVAVIGLGWGGLEALKHNRAEKEIVVLQQERQQLTNRVEQLNRSVIAAERAATLAGEERRKAIIEKDKANAQLRQALRDHPGWASQRVPDSVRNAINRGHGSTAAP